MGLLFPVMLDHLGFGGSFYFFSVAMVVVAVYGFVVLPENKGQSLVATEDKFDKAKTDTETEPQK